MSDGVSFFSFKNSLIFARFQFPFLQGNYWRWRVGREIFPMIYFQSLSPWETDSGRLKQGIEIKRKYENYKIRWRLCQLLMHLKMEKIDASLSEKWFKSLCAGSSLVLSKRFSYQNNWRALYFCDTPVCFGQDVSLTYCQCIVKKELSLVRIYSVRCERKKAKYSIWLLIQNKPIQVFHRSGCAEKPRLYLPIHNRISSKDGKV